MFGRTADKVERADEGLLRALDMLCDWGRGDGAKACAGGYSRAGEAQMLDVHMVAASSASACAVRS